MEEKKEKKSKKWILVLILALLLISALAVLGVVFVPKILDSLNIKKGGSSISENTSDTGSYITIDYGKRVTITGDSKEMYDGLMYINGYDETIYEEFEEEATNNTLDEALELVLRKVIGYNKITNNTGILFVDVEHVKKDRQHYLDTISEVFTSSGLASVEIVSYQYDDLTDQAKEYLKLKSACYSKTQYASLISKKSSLKFEDLLSKSNAELKTAYKKYVSSGSEVKEDTTPTNNTATNTGSKCNNGYVYVSEEKKCFNSHKTKDIVWISCGEGHVNDSASCYQVVDESYCESGNDQYSHVSGKCVDNYTVAQRGWKCPTGYANIWGNYGGQTFNGDCYHYENPNY